MNAFTNMVTKLIYIFVGVVILLFGIAIANPEVLTRILVR